MSGTRIVDETAGTAASERFLPLMLLLFVGSGCAALIYEVVWFQLLSLVIGASSVSLGVLLGTFMGGMCLGSLLFPRFVSKSHHPLRVYAFLEVGIGVIGLAVLFGMPLVGGLYTAWAGSGTFGLIFRGVIAGICLLPPTLLMGATLPAIARYVETSPRGVAWMGFFYGGNIAGAVLGSLLAGYYLLRVYDQMIATFVAVALNIAVALLAIALSKWASYTPQGEATAAAQSSTSAWAVYITIGLSGMTALAAEVLWTRHLSLLFGATVYTFSLILAVFLLGLGIGSSAGAALGRRLRQPRMALGWCQLLLCAGMGWASYAVTQSLPFWPIDLTLNSDSWIGLQLDIVRAIWAMLPAAILWGASFPLALAAVARPGQDPARLIGGLYAANTVGAIVGATSSSLLLVYWLGSQSTQQILIVIAAVSGFLMLLPFGAAAIRERLEAASPLEVGVASVCVVLIVRSILPVPDSFVAYGRFMPVRAWQADVIYMGEGLTASVAVSETPDGIRNYHNAGKVQASSDPADMRLQRMLGHLTTLVPDNPHSFLVIGCGAGVTAGAVSINPEMQRVVIAEIEPLVPEVVSTYFGNENYNVVDNPKVEIRIDDGRHYLLTTDEKFDGITSDPLDPWVRGAAALYTKEFFEMVRDHLNPGGVVTLFVQLYESTEDAAKSEIATFFEVFPNGAVFANTINGQGYDLVLLGQNDPDMIDVSRMHKRLNSSEYSQVRQSLNEINIYSAVDLLSTFAGQKTDMSTWLSDAQINRDRNLRLQYLAGLGLNLYQADIIYNHLVSAGVQYPPRLFTGAPELLLYLQNEIARRQGR